MTRTRRIVGAGLAALATLAALTVAGQASAAARITSTSPQVAAAPLLAQDDEDPRGGYGYDYERPSPPPDVTPPEVPETPPPDVTTPPEVPVTPPPDVTTPPITATPTTVSPGGPPTEVELPVTGAPMGLLTLIGGLIVVAGVALRLLARRRSTR